MRVLVRADAGVRQGAGHVMRSLAVAEAAGAAGWDIVVSADLSAVRWVEPWVAAMGGVVVPPVHDPAAIAGLIGACSAQVVVLDHYRFPDAKQEVESAGATLVNFEDGVFGRRPAHVAVDYSLHAERRARPADGSETLLRGIDYAPMRAAIVSARRARGGRVPGSRLGLAALGGGTDRGRLVDSVMRAADRGRVRRVDLPPGLDMPGGLCDVDAVVSAAGVSVYELCCVGVPTAVVAAAANQRDNYVALTAEDVVTGLGDLDRIARDRGGFERDLNAWISDAERLLVTGDRGRRLVDGLGAGRIAGAFGAGHPPVRPPVR